MYANKRTRLRLFRFRLHTSWAPIHTEEQEMLKLPLLASTVFAEFTEIHNSLSFFFTRRMGSIWSYPLGLINLHIFEKCWVTISNSSCKITNLRNNNPVCCILSYFFSRFEHHWRYVWTHFKFPTSPSRCKANNRMQNLSSINTHLKIIILSVVASRTLVNTSHYHGFYDKIGLTPGSHCVIVYYRMSKRGGLYKELTQVLGTGTLVLNSVDIGKAFN